MDGTESVEREPKLWELIARKRIELGDRLTVRLGKRVMFTASPEGIEAIEVMTTRWETNRLLAWMTPGPQLWLVALRTADREFQLNASDRGFPELIAWLAA